MTKHLSALLLQEMVSRCVTSTNTRIQLSQQWQLGGEKYEKIHFLLIKMKYKTIKSFHRFS